VLLVVSGLIFFQTKFFVSDPFPFKDSMLTQWPRGSHSVTYGYHLTNVNATPLNIHTFLGALSLAVPL
jgi:hypothetical protein